MTISKLAFRMTALTSVTLSRMTFRIYANIKTPNQTVKYVQKNLTMEPSMLTVIKLNGIILGGIMVDGIMLSGCVLLSIMPLY
jgi:hypothetical protein